MFHPVCENKAFLVLGNVQIESSMSGLYLFQSCTNTFFVISEMSGFFLGEPQKKIGN